MKRIFLATLFCLGIAFIASAQPGNRRTPEERAAQIHQKLDSAFKIEKDVFTKLDTALVQLYKAQDAKRQELMAGGMPDRETFMAEMKKFTDARDEILKAVLKEEDFKVWKEKIEPSMRPQRTGGGGGPGGSNR
jgi:periplasmic protein CpxP/Spy